MQAYDGTGRFRPGQGAPKPHGPKPEPSAARARKSHAPNARAAIAEAKAMVAEAKALGPQERAHLPRSLPAPSIEAHAAAPVAPPVLYPPAHESGPPQCGASSRQSPT